MLQPKTSSHIILYLYLKYEGNWNKIYNAILTKEEIDEDLYYTLDVEGQKEKFVTILDEEYPDKLKKAYRPPFAFHKYDLEYFTNRILTLDLPEILDLINK